MHVHKDYIENKENSSSSGNEESSDQDYLPDVY